MDTHKQWQELETAPGAGLQIESFGADFAAIEAEVSKAIIGQKEIIRDVLCGVIAGGNVLLEGLPGLGKTQMVKAFGQALALSFSRIQFTPDLMPADVTGTDVMIKDSQGAGAFEFQKGPVFANLVLADEINRATPKTQSALLEAMQEKTVTVGKNTYQLPHPFFVLATQNPLEMEGTYPLPEAQMDRFMLKLNVAFPSEAELSAIVLMTTGGAQNGAGKLFSPKKISEMGRAAALVPVSEPVMAYAMGLIMKTHPEHEASPDAVKKYVRYGASPRGAQALITLARIYALVEGRFNVSYDDVDKALLPVLRHRLFLNFEAVSDNVMPDSILKELFHGENR